MNEIEFREELLKIGINITDEQISKLEHFYQLLVEWNKKINLTRIINKEDVYLKHFYDSLTLIKAVDLTQKINVCDIGTGAGFPGIVLKIVFPNLRIVLIDSLNKRIEFLKHVIKELGLEDIEPIHDRAEIYIKNNRNKFDLITTRAMAKLNIISEICLPGLKNNCLFVPMKANIEEEIKDTKYLSILNSEIINVVTFNLPKENSIRNLIVIRKNGDISLKYPREYNKIMSIPLG